MFGKHICSMSVVRAALLSCEDGRRHAEARVLQNICVLHMIVKATRESILLLRKFQIIWRESNAPVV